MTGAYVLNDSTIKLVRMSEKYLNKKGYEYGSFVYYKKSGEKDFEEIFYPFRLTEFNLCDCGNFDSFSDSIMNGAYFFRSYFKNGNLKEESFRLQNGYVHGERLDYFNKSQKISRIRTYYDGYLDGLSKSLLSDGVVISLKHFTNDKKDGLQSYFNMWGKLKKTQVYKNGQLIQTIRY